MLPDAQNDPEKAELFKLAEVGALRLFKMPLAALMTKLEHGGTPITSDDLEALVIAGALQHEPSDAEPEEIERPLIATAKAHPNIAFIKYWGNLDDKLRLPANPSLSMNLAELETVTTVEFSASLQADELLLDDKLQSGAPLTRVAHHLDFIRSRAGFQMKARVESRNNFPTGAGIASSASAFAALSLAGAQAAGLQLSEAELSTLARLGSGSAARSVPSGFVEWYMGQDSGDSYAASIASPKHWDLVDVIAIITKEHKAVGSTGGHAIASTSPLQAARVATVADRLNRCRTALLQRDFPTFADIIEADSNIMHAVMLTSAPPLYYWEPETLQVMTSIRAWRNEGVPVAFTIDAGPNVHCLCLASAADEVEMRLRNLGIKELMRATPGDGAELIA